MRTPRNLLALLLLSLPLQAQAVVGETWKLIPFDTHQDHRFGSSADTDGELLAVGAQSSGDVYLYRRVLDGWVLDAKLHPNVHGFGWEVSLDGDRMVVADGTIWGAAHVYHRTVAGWSLEDRIDPHFSASHTDDFASNVALRGDRLLVTAEGLDQHGTDSGAVFLYERTGSDWNLVQELVPDDAGPDLSFGSSVTLTDEVLFVGAQHRAGDRGAVYVFRSVGGTWVQTQRLRSPDDTPSFEFGTDIAAEADLLVVGEPENDTGAVGSGAGWVFRETPSGYRREARLVPSDALAWETNGTRVDLAGSLVLLGSAYRGGALWELEGSAWNEVARFERAALNGANFGAAQALTTEHVVITDRVDSSGAHQAGAAYLYDLPAMPIAGTFCLGNGSNGSCPCGNDALPGALTGCAHSGGEGTSLVAAGSPSVSADDLVLGAHPLPFGEKAVLFATHASQPATPFGCGLYCLAGPLLRFPPVDFNSSHWGPGLNSPGWWWPGETWTFQAVVRDQHGFPGGGLNISNGLRLTFSL